MQDKIISKEEYSEIKEILEQLYKTQKQMEKDEVEKEEAVNDLKNYIYNWQMNDRKFHDDDCLRSTFDQLWDVVEVKGDYEKIEKDIIRIIREFNILELKYKAQKLLSPLEKVAEEPQKYDAYLDKDTKRLEEWEKEDKEWRNVAEILKFIN